VKFTKVRQVPKLS